MATNKQQARIQKRRRLEALFDRGEYVRFNSDSDGHPIVNPETEDKSDMKIWVGPPSPLQREMAVREAQAARARTMINARDKEDSEEWLAVRGFLQGVAHERLVDYVLDIDDNEFITQARRDILKQKQWDDFNEFRDAMRQYEEAGAPEDDPEWNTLLERDNEFGRQVLTRADEIKDGAREGYKLMPRVKLEEKALDKRIEQAGSASFLTEYEDWMVFYACRDDEDHSELYFEHPKDIKALPEPVQEALVATLRKYITEASEAKN